MSYELIWIKNLGIGPVEGRVNFSKLVDQVAEGRSWHGESIGASFKSVGPVVLGL